MKTLIHFFTLTIALLLLGCRPCPTPTTVNCHETSKCCIKDSTEVKVRWQYFLKIYKKNNGGDLTLTTQDPKTGADISALGAKGLPGYFPIEPNSTNFEPNWYARLILPENDASFLRLRSFRWRNGGDPGGRPFQNIKFQLLAISDDQNGAPIPVSEIIDITTLNYYDEFGITLLVNPLAMPAENYKMNTTLFKEWKAATGRP
jgi:hypothetical protein